jgi:hypothetical protein
MLRPLRYALATFCFAASVGCLALWGWSFDQHITLQRQTDAKHFIIEARGGYLIATAWSFPAPVAGKSVLTGSIWTIEKRTQQDRFLELIIADSGSFGLFRSSPHFPLWYPALVFALAGVAALRLGRRFTIRSAIIATTVVAGLLGMAAGM